MSLRITSVSRTIELVDVRIPIEFSGEVLAPPENPTEHAQRGETIMAHLNQQMN
jgi:hypothetical protein